MSDRSGQSQKAPLHEVRYSLTDLLKEVKAERESSSIGQEIVDQEEISKVFNRKKKVRRGKSGE
ncbi:MAG: hypothetical protein ACO3ZW_03315 [Opitutales bacterium]|jgi:hypothetical protein